MAMFWIKYLPHIFVNLAMESNINAMMHLLMMARKLYHFMMILALLFSIWLLSFSLGQGPDKLLLVGYNYASAGCCASLRMATMCATIAGIAGSTKC